MDNAIVEMSKQIKFDALKISKGNFDCKMQLSSASLTELKWWLENLPDSSSDVLKPIADVVIHSDASLSGLGATMGESSTGGHWSTNEGKKHINYLEILAACKSQC